jgi:hypothetical protein
VSGDGHISPCDHHQLALLARTNLGQSNQAVLPRQQLDGAARAKRFHQQTIRLSSGQGGLQPLALHLLHVLGDPVGPWRAAAPPDPSAELASRLGAQHHQRLLCFLQGPVVEVGGEAAG